MSKVRKIDKFKDSDDNPDNPEIYGLVYKEGRRPYNPDIPKEPNPDYTKREVPENYVSIQGRINTGPGGTVNERELTRYLNKGNFIKLEKPSKIKEKGSGIRFIYITKDNKFRSGGYLINCEYSNTEYDLETEENVETLKKKKMFLSYVGHNNGYFTVQEQDISDLWVNPNKFSRKYKEKEKEEPVILERPVVIKEGKYPAIVEDSDGNPVVIKYFRDNYNLIRFYDSSKYTKIIENGFVFK